MRVGIIGSGNIAKIHVPIILQQPDIEIVGFADQNIARAKAAASELNVTHFYQDAEIMLDEQNPDIVHVLTPPHYHAQLSIMAMNKGCHVLVEKPMAVTMEDAEKMIEIAKRNNTHLCVNHNMIFLDVIQRAMKMVSAGIIGELVSVETHFLFNALRYSDIIEDGAEYCHWSYRLNGGPLQDLMPHPASLIVEFVPKIEKVQWIGINRGVLPIGWDDEIRALIKSSSIFGYISISLSERPDTISCTFKGRKGQVQTDDFSGILTLRTESTLPRAVARGLSGLELAFQNLKGTLGNIYKFAAGRIDKSDGIEPVISRFYESIRSGGEMPISTDKSLRVIDLMTRIWPSPTVDTREIKPKHTTKGKHGGTTALVTGASGFIGTHLIKKLLSEDITVRALVRPNSIHAGRLHTVDVDIVEGDLSDPQAVDEATRGIETIYHAGSAVSNSWEEHEEITIKGTELLVKASLAQGVERFVHFSTLAVYELLDSKESKITEDSPYQKDPKRMGPYAYAKIEAEKIVFDAYRKEGLGVTVVRPGMVIGPMGRIFFPHLGYRFEDSIFLLIGKGDTILPITYVENTVDGIYKASIVEKAIGQAYNLIDDGEITAKSYLEKYVKINSNQARIIHLPYILPYGASLAYEILAYLGFVRKGVTSRAQLKWKQSKVRFDNTKAKSELGWAPKISLEEGLTRTFKWYALKYSPKE